MTTPTTPTGPAAGPESGSDELFGESAAKSADPAVSRIKRESPNRLR